MTEWLAKGGILMGIFSKLKESLTKTRQGFVDKVTQLVTGRKAIDEEFYEELEEILIQGDVGVNTTLELIGRLRKVVKERKISEPVDVKGVLKELIADILIEHKNAELYDVPNQINVILVVGVNGAGKTTTIGKLAATLKEDGKKIVLVAGDTFRAAAIEQLTIWADRANCEIIKHQEGSDPAAIVFDAIQSAKNRKYDYVIVDTAGRLQNKVNLMEELKKIRRVIERELPGNSPEVLLILDATTGQNALSQAKIFKETTEVTGLVLTKLDGTAKGGIVIAISNEMDIPVKYIGVGEKQEDLRKFDAAEFVEALFA